ncbi:hypothetical protein MMC30_006183 [Trapelia coarctata]|nr:hypothetical protein [Trapelia coarctata]
MAEDRNDKLDEVFGSDLDGNAALPDEDVYADRGRPTSDSDSKDLLQTDLQASIDSRESKSPLLTLTTPQGTQSRLGDYFLQTEEARAGYSDWDIQEISRLLTESGRLAWGQVPRLYIVLRHISQLQVLDNILDEGITDIWFPFTLSSLPTVFSSSLQVQFLESQPLVLTKAVDLEKGVGKKHAHFGRDELFPFQIKGKLGSGGYATVDKIFSSFSGREFARKRFRRGRGKSSKGEIESFKTELQVLKRIHHHHCVELVASYTDPKYFGLIMSPVADCNMAQFYDLVEADPEKSALLRGFYGCLANGLSYLHDTQIRHRDIKPENVLVKGQNVYLTDFGISLDWEALTRSTTTDDSAKSWVYCSPEVANYEKRNSSSDIWSLGCVFLEMSTVLKGHNISAMRTSFRKHTESYKFFQNIPAIREWSLTLRESGSSLDNSTLDWALSMLQKEPERRPSAHDLYAMIANTRKDTKARTLLFLGDCCSRDEDDTSSSESAFDDGSAWAEDMDDGLTSPPVTDTSLRPLVVQEKQVIVDDTKVQGVDVDHFGLQITAMPKLTSPVRQTDALASHDVLPPAPAENIRSLSTETIKGSPFTPIARRAEALPSSDAASEWPIIDLDGVLPLLGPSSWNTPSALLTSVRSNERFMQYLKNNAAGCHELLLEATTEDIAKLIQMLLRGGLKVDDPDIRDLEGWVPVLQVLDWGECSNMVFKTMVDSGATLEVQTLYGHTPLSRACALGNTVVLNFLLDRGVDVNYSGVTDEYYGRQSVLFVAAKFGQLEAVKLLLDHGAVPDPKTTYKNATPLFVSSENGHENVVQFLLENYGAEIDIEARSDGKFSPLYIASSKGHRGTVKILLSNGAVPGQSLDYNESYWMPIHTASANGHVDVVQLLLTHGARVSPISSLESGNQTPLHLASQYGHVEVVRLLLLSGASVSETTTKEYGRVLNPLHLALQAGHTETVRLLLENSAEGAVFERSNSGWMPLHYASRHGHTELVQFLLDRGAKVEEKTNQADGWTACHLASMHGHTETVQLLLANGASPLTKAGTHEWTPLCSAASNGHLETARVLVDNGARVLEKTRPGLLQRADTAISLAKKGHHTDVVTLLELTKKEQEKQGEPAPRIFSLPRNILGGAPSDIRWRK